YSNTRAKSRDRFLRKFRVSLGAVDQLSAGVVAELHLSGDAIRKWQTATSRPGRLRQDADRCSQQEAKEIEKVARFTQNTAAALGKIRIPMIRVELPCGDTETD